MSSNSIDSLHKALEQAMPIWLAELKELHALDRGSRARRWANEAVREINSGRIHADRARDRGATARLFNVLSRGLAAISLQPGGVTVFGRTWCARHYPHGLQRRPGEWDNGCELCVTGQRVYEGLPPRRQFVKTLEALAGAL